MPAGVSAYVPLANLTLGANASTVTFSSISQSYRDLVFVLVCTTTGTAFSRMRINGDTSGNYSYVTMAGTGSNAQSAQANGANNFPLPVTSTMESGVNWQNIIQLFDYTQTNKGKTGLQRADNSSVVTTAGAIRWGNSSAITSVEFSGNNQPFAAGSTFALYGIAS
jgi:hypothetical protein